jgi:hypothetical protein
MWNIICNLLLGTYVISMLGAALFITSQLPELEKVAIDVDPYFLRRSALHRNGLIFSASFFLVFVPAVNTFVLVYAVLAYLLFGK